MFITTSLATNHVAREENPATRERFTEPSQRAPAGLAIK